MNLNTDNVHEYMIKSTSTVQITLDDDFNVPDQKADIESCVKEWGEVVVGNVKVNQDKAFVDGELAFAVLYIGKGNGLTKHPVKMSGKMPFEETVNLPKDASEDYVTCKAYIDDLTIKPVNSRKLSVKAIVTLEITCENVENISMAIDINDCDEKLKPEILTKELDFAQLVINQRDNFRIKESCSLPQSKPVIKDIIWDDLDIRCFNARIKDSGIVIKGEINAFIMYVAEDESQSVCWYETNVPFEGELDISGCNQDMIPYIGYTVTYKSVEVREDMDGENKDLALEMVLDLDVKAYEEKHENVISDIYIPKKDITITRKDTKLKKLLIRNNSTCRVSGNAKVEEFSGLLQICNCTAALQLDDCHLTDGKIKAEGAVCVNVFYISSNDSVPMGSVRTVIPFDTEIDIPGSDKEDQLEFKIRPTLEALSANINSNGMIEIKAVVSLDVICFKIFNYSGIEDIQVEDGECQAYKAMPSFIGCIATGNDSLWDICKKYNTSMERVKQINPEVCGSLKECPTDKLDRGTKLLIVKSR